MTIEATVVGWEGNTGWEWDGTGSPPASWSAPAAASLSTRSVYGLRINPSSAISDDSHQYSGAKTGYGVGQFKFRFNSSLPSADIVFFRHESSGNQPRFELMFRNSDDKLVARAFHSGSVAETQEGPVLSADTIYTVDFLSGTQSGSGSKRFEWQVNGVGYPTVGPNSSYLGGVFTTRLGYDTSATFNLDLDDFIIITNSDSAQTADDATVAALFPLASDGSVRALRPSASGTHSNSGNFTPSTGVIADSWQLLDDVPVQGSGYVEQDANGGSYLEYELTDLDAEETNIVAVGCTDAYRTPSVSTANRYIDLVDGGDSIDVVGTAQGIISGAETRVKAHDVPLPTSAWTQARVNALKIRWGFSDDVSPNPRCHGLLVNAFTTEGEPEPAGWPEAYIGMHADPVAV